jgi:hypothetical protein
MNLLSVGSISLDSTSKKKRIEQRFYVPVAYILHLTALFHIVSIFVHGLEFSEWLTFLEGDLTFHFRWFAPREVTEHRERKLIYG